VIRQLIMRSRFYNGVPLMDLVPTEWATFARYRRDVGDHSVFTFADTKTLGSDVCPDMECAWTYGSVSGDVRAVERALGSRSRRKKAAP
jgi:hypothetical protein